ncbi:ankyrin repeat-containing domain protein [Xylaria palmicola]|nr:ankyrin repeat-containing domain protein [Xylaria palmicola]
MHLFDFPVELFHEILVSSILARSDVGQYRPYIGRVLRLKLVSKAFYRAFQPALFQSHVLDDMCSYRPMTFSPTGRHYGADQLWRSYLVYRIRNQTDPDIGWFSVIPQVAKEFCEATQADYDEIVSELCWLALALPPCAETWFTKNPNPRSNLLSAAAYFGHLDLAKQLVPVCCPTEKDLFASPMMLAAYAGNSDMLRLFQEHLPEFEDQIPGNEDGKWRAKTGPGSIAGAAMRGDMDMLRLAIYPPSRATPDSSDFHGQKIGEVSCVSQQGGDLYHGYLVANNLETRRYIRSFFKSAIAPPAFDDQSHFHEYAQEGNVEMIGEILDTGFEIETVASGLANQVEILGYHLDVIELLLTRGSDPDAHYRQLFTSALPAAAAAGSMKTIRMLIDHGADAKSANIAQQMWMLHSAVKLEHTEMVEFFFEQGLLGRACPGWIRELVEEEGLESMVELLKKWGTPAELRENGGSLDE